MLNVERTNRFKKDFKLMKKRGKDMDKIKSVVSSLVKQEKLEARFCDHALSGNYSYARECHIEPDWLLIYWSNDITLTLDRTGTHSDLFG